MVDFEEKAAKQLGEITKCPICMNAFSDPRMLPCIHTFCFECVKLTAEAAEKKPGDRMPCPLCRKDFIIPEDGMFAVQRNFFMEGLLELNSALLQIENVTITCDMCNVRSEGKTGDIPKATMRCLECKDNYCDSCVKVHQFQKLSRNHQLVKIGSDAASEMNRRFSTVHCTEHSKKLLDYYCADCKKIVCVSCFVESHSSHKCKDVTTVDGEFRQAIERNSSRARVYADEMLLLRRNADSRKSDFLKKIVDNENAIHRRNQDLKDMIDEHTKSLFDELSVMKSKHLTEIATEMEEIDRHFTILRSFEAYCNELITKGSASDICSSVDQLNIRADELERGSEEFICRPPPSIEVSFQTTDFRRVLHKSQNLLGQVKGITSHFEKFAIVEGLDDGWTLTDDVIKINLHRPNEISTQRHIPTRIVGEAVATTYRNTVYVTGTGTNNDEIWKYNVASGWVKCASLVQGRRRHSAAFINRVLYICGGFVYSNQNVIDSVEAFNAVTDECNPVGELVNCVWSSGNCGPFRRSLYIFGGKNTYYRDVSHVQVYNTEQNTCTLLSKPMPRPSSLMQAALWETSAILFGQNTCFIFDFEAETWQEREQFKTEVRHFGLVLFNETVLVIGGVGSYSDIFWKCRDDVRYVPLKNIVDDKPIEWKIHGKLPKPSFVKAYGEMWMTI